ncbi:hypothetical protein JCM30760_17320 [Thiomicrorhabdus hydrogeniphila]
MQINEALYPIREVSNLTGVNSITLRAWERRYGLIEPVRTEGGHRLYTQKHIDQIKAAVALTEQGVAISQVKALLDEQANTQKIDFKVGESDFQNRLTEYAFSYDSEQLNIELDNLFNDLAELYWLPVLSSVTKMLKQESRSGFIFWESQLIPRLQTRMRFAMRSMNIATTQPLWLESKPGTSQSILLLAALSLTQKGYYPYVNLYSIYADQQYKELDATLHTLQCNTVAFVDDSKDFDKVFWSKWVDNHPLMTVHFFLEENENTSLDGKANCFINSIHNFA